MFCDQHLLPSLNRDLCACTHMNAPEHTYAEHILKHGTCNLHKGLTFLVFSQTQPLQKQ